MEEKIEIVKKTIKDNLSQNKYKKLSKEDSEIIREEYLKGFVFIPEKNEVFCNSLGTAVAEGYIRIVVGDYGAYLEFLKEQVKHKNITNRFYGEPKRPVKYIWMQTIDKEKTKVYFQKGFVSYADYQPEMFYVDPGSLYVSGKKIYNEVI